MPEKMNQRVKFSIIFLFASITSCNNTPVQITLEVPDNFQGVIFIKNKKPNDFKPVNKKEIIIIVPESGIAVTENYDNLHEWHQININSKNNTGEAFHLFDLGEINGETARYFYGKSEIYEKKIRVNSTFILKPGKYP
jgi:hypothetical protein